MCDLGCALRRLIMCTHKHTKLQTCTRIHLLGNAEELSHSLLRDVENHLRGVPAEAQRNQVVRRLKVALVHVDYSSKGSKTLDHL